jgi:hypothetical protein
MKDVQNFHRSTILYLFLKVGMRILPKAQISEIIIALNSAAYGKILDNIILIHFCDKLISCDYQFGFKPKNFISLCSTVFERNNR